MEQEFHATADFTKSAGVLKKRIHGSNAAPNLASRGYIDFAENYKKMHFTQSRTHDWPLWNPGQRMIDTHFIFPLMKLDPKDPSNYYFDSTDEIIRICQDAGSKIYYRLGTSIEHSGSRHFNTFPPEDFEKYAEVLAGIVRHYTRGWANGFRYDIPDWEIWNEATNGPTMWCGTQAEFERFFTIVLKRLKSEFPELRVGGPAYCSFNPESLGSLLKACRKAGTEPDFLSWHNYSADEKNMIAEPAAARKLADSLGFPKIELHITEWHYFETTWSSLAHHVTEDGFRSAMTGPEGLQGIDSAAFNLAVLTGWQDSPLDAACYYGAGIDSTWGFRDFTYILNKNYFSMRMFGDLNFHFSKRIRAKSACGSVYVLGAVSDDGKTGRLLVSDYRGEEPVLSIRVDGMENADVSAVILDSVHDMTPTPALWRGGVLTLAKNSPGSAAFAVTFERN